MVEALSCGRPVVATDVGGIPELVKAECGILIPPRNAESLRAALESALAATWDPYRISAVFQRDWQKVADETFAVCERVLESVRALA